MSSYHTSFTYKNENSFTDKDLIIVSFEPDTGFTDSYLSMENISDNYFDGTRRFDYGSKYTTSAEIQISVIKKDGSDMTLNEFRSYAKWLTGARVNSWLDMYVGDTLIYSFLGKFLNFEQYKYDARTIGFRVTFSSVSPWAFSAPQVFNCSIGQVLSVVENNDEVIVVKSSDENEGSINLGVNKDGVLCTSYLDEGSYFNILDDGTMYIDTSYHTTIDNQSDDLYTYIDLDIEYTNVNSTEISINNKTLGEKAIIRGIDANEIISLSAKQFIVSYNIDSYGNKIRNTHKIFGDNFNFVWPRLAPGLNEFSVYGSGKGKAEFTYRYPMKIGDCVIDIDVNGNGIYCGCGDTPNSDPNLNDNCTCTVSEAELNEMLEYVLG